jgi:hypothetical protein
MHLLVLPLMRMRLSIIIEGLDKVARGGGGE